jgi:hypothetical protein
MDVAKSKNDVSIRLSEDRWFHITEEQFGDGRLLF